MHQSTSQFSNVDSQTIDDHDAASDAMLAHRACGRDKRAFVEIVARHQAMVCGIALSVLGDFAASEDAAQEAFLNAWRKIHELRDPERLRAWLAQIARNAALGHLRRREGKDHENIDEFPSIADEFPTPDEIAANDDEAALVRAALSNLPENYREPLILFYREDQSVSAVAATLGISEDAVKQRLARGREMLRERMTGLIETVLKRSGPTAVFTMTIAAAIGALATPAAIASSAFGAATAVAGTTVGSTTSSAPFWTFMNTSKAFFIAAGVVTAVCIPVGYHLAPIANRQTQIADIQSSLSNSIPAKAANPSSLQISPLIAEWNKLHAAYGTNAAAMPALYKAIGDLSDPFRRRAFRSALIAEWVQLDPHGGLSFIFGKSGDTSQRRQFMEEWLARDPDKAVDALLASADGWQEAGRECLTEIARRAPSRLGDVVSRLPKPESYWDTNVRDAFAIVAERDLATARTAAENMTGENRVQALSGISRAWATKDFHAAVNWAKSLPEGTDRDEVIRAALLGKATVDPIAALESAGIVPAGGRHAYSSSTTSARILIEAAQKDFESTVAWLAEHPGRFGRDDLMGLSKTVTDRINADATGFLGKLSAEGSLSAVLPAVESALLNSAASQREPIWEWLKTQDETPALKQLRDQVMAFSGYQDPDLALRIVSDIPATPEGDKQLLELARCLYNGGNRLYRFDGLYEQASDRFRPSLAEAAFKSLSSESFDNPQRWIDRLGLLPTPATRIEGVQSLARVWGEQNPETALTWADSLQESERNKAAAAVTGSWAKRDPAAAAEFVNSLPIGMERNQSASALAVVVAETLPREAWQWMLSITDESLRDTTAAATLSKIGARDSATAQQWIAAGPFSPEIKVQLQASLNSLQSKRTK